MGATPTLTMLEFLVAVDSHGTRARRALIGQGIHPNVIYTKAEKAARKGYTDYGVAPDLCWLTDKGRAYIDPHHH